MKEGTIKRYKVEKEGRRKRNRILPPANRYKYMIKNNSQSDKDRKVKIV